MPSLDFEVPETAVGVALCRMMSGDRCRMYETLMFSGGAAAIDTAFRRARTFGSVGPLGETGEQWADLYGADGSMVETVALSEAAFRGLRDRILRCKVDITDGDPIPVRKPD